MNEPTWIIDGFNELIMDLLFALVIFLDSTHAQPLKSLIFGGKTNTIAIANLPRPASQQLPPAGSFKCRAGVPLCSSTPDLACTVMFDSL